MTDLKEQLDQAAATFAPRENSLAQMMALVEKRRRRRRRRLWGRSGSALAVILALSAIAVPVLHGQRSTPRSSGSLPTTTFATSPARLTATVTAVTATLAPYNPEIASAGIPEERVDFSVRGSLGGPLTCTIEVRHSGILVGTSLVGIGPPLNGPRSSQKESVAVSITGKTFAGRPSDAHVDCHNQT
jgi:hypothetical protein